MGAHCSAHRLLTPDATAFPVSQGVCYCDAIASAVAIVYSTSIFLPKCIPIIFSDCLFTPRHLQEEEEEEEDSFTLGAVLHVWAIDVATVSGASAKALVSARQINYCFTFLRTSFMHEHSKPLFHSFSACLSYGIAA